MIVIQMQGGLINGIFTDNPALVGKPVVVADADVEGGDEPESIVKINEADWHLNVFDVEGVRDVSPEFFPELHKWAEENLIEGIEWL